MVQYVTQFVRFCISLEVGKQGAFTIDNGKGAAIKLNG